VSYGTDYYSLVWPLNKTQGRHDGYEEPVYSWVPSIGVSSLIGVERGDLFPIWKGDLLVSSLRAVSLFRIRIVDQRVVFAEPIEIGQRIRSLVEGLDGRLVLWTDDHDIVSIRPATTMSRELLFANMCGGCHKAMDGRTHMIGPDLAHAYGRRIASAEGYTDYSAALKKLSGRWDERKLDAFLTNPQAAVPGTVMPFAGIADPKQRAAIIDFLKSVK
jgi:cytochrome c2